MLAVVVPNPMNSVSTLTLTFSMKSTLNVVVPASFSTSRMAGLTKRTRGVGACVTITTTGLFDAYAAILMVAVRLKVVVLASYPQVMVPGLLPLAPDVILSQLLAGVTEAAHEKSNISSPTFTLKSTLNVTVPASPATYWVVGLTESENPSADTTAVNISIINPKALTHVLFMPIFLILMSACEPPPSTQGNLTWFDCHYTISTGNFDVLWRLNLNGT